MFVLAFVLIVFLLFPFMDVALSTVDGNPTALHAEESRSAAVSVDATIEEYGGTIGELLQTATTADEML